MKNNLSYLALFLRVPERTVGIRSENRTAEFKSAIGCLARAMMLAASLVPVAISRATPSFPLVDERSGEPITQNKKVTKAIVIIHGWNPDNVDDFYALSGGRELFALKTALKAKLIGTDWSLITFHWERDTDGNDAFSQTNGANTGAIGIKEPIALGKEALKMDDANAIRAAINADARGITLADELNRVAPDIREVQFIAHSAGSWAARSAVGELLALNPYVVVQVTLLDPYIPYPHAPSGSFSDAEMTAVQFFSSNGRLLCLENYYADDSPEAGWNLYPWGGSLTDPTFFTAWTQERFRWNRQFDVELQVDWGGPSFVYLGFDMIFYRTYYDWHSGPIQFYADTVSTDVGTSPPSSLPTGNPYDYRRVGWNRSLHEIWEAALPRITSQPQDTTVTSGGTGTFSVEGSGVTKYNWYKVGNGWVGSGPVLTLRNVVDSGEYVVRLENDNGPLYSRKAVLSVGAPTLSISSVSPATFLGVPLPGATRIKIFGAGFSAASTLILNDGAKNYNSEPGRLLFVNGNEIDYDLRTDAIAAQWTVKVVNGSQTSLPVAFKVTAAAVATTSTGSLFVRLSPAGAITAGAQWQVDNLGLQADGQAIGYIPTGSHTITFKAVPGYTTPASQTVAISANQQTAIMGTYTPIAPSTYALSLNFDSTRGVASAWPTQPSGGYAAGTVVQLSASTKFNQRFTGWSGDAGGSSNPTTIVMNGNKAVTANFAAGDPSLGTLTVTIKPDEAAAAGVKWGFNADDFRVSGSSITTFPGPYILTLHPADGWTGPASTVATIVAGTTTPVTVNFTEDPTPGLLTVTLAPANATGAKWRVDGGTAQGGGATVSLAPGNHSVTFDSVPGWTAPLSQSVEIKRGQTSVVNGTYAPPLGLPVIVSVQPKVGALTGGTQLTIDGINLAPANGNPPTVTVGGQPATNVAVVSNSRVTCFMPSSSVYGTAPIVVQTPGGTATDSTNFAYGFPRGNGIELAGSIGGVSNAVAVQGNYSFIGEGSTFTVLDISNKTTPTPVSRLPLPGIVEDVALFSTGGKQYAAVANGDAGVQIVDVSTPTSPALRGYYQTGGWVYGITVSGTVAYAACYDAGVVLLDISSPSAPSKLSSVAVVGNAFSIVTQQSGGTLLAYVGTESSLCVVDVTSSGAPLLRGTATPGASLNGACVGVLGNRAFIATFQTLIGFDVSNPDSPSSLGIVAPGDGVQAIAIANGHLYGIGTQGLIIYDLVGGNLQQVGAYGGQFGDLGMPDRGRRVAVSAGYVFSSGGEKGFHVYNATTPTSPVFSGIYLASIGSYNAAAASGNYAFVATENNGLKVLDVSSAAGAVPVAQYTSSYNGGFGGELIKLGSSRAYFLGAQLEILDVSNPQQTPTLLGSIPQSQFVTKDVCILGNSIVTAGWDSSGATWKPSVAVFDASKPGSLVRQSSLTYTTQGNVGVASIATNGSLVCAAVQLSNASASSLIVIDATNPGNIQQRSSLPDIGSPSLRSMRFSPNGRYLYVGGNPTWKIIDLADSAAPSVACTLDIGAATYGFDFKGSTAFLTTSKGVMAYDVSAPMAPQLLRSYSLPTLPFQGNLTVSGNILYAPDGSGGLSILTLSDLDVPSVVISQPTASSAWTNTTGILDLAGSASDNQGLVQGSVAAVKWSNSRGGGGSATGSGSWSVNGIILQTGDNLITVTATDGAGNTGTASMTVSYQPPKKDQTITLVGIPDHVFGDSPVSLAAAASSGLDVHVEVSGPATYANGVLMLTGAGSVAVQATQDGNSSFNAAPEVDFAFNVAKADQSISFDPIPNQSSLSPPIPLSATVNSGQPVYFSVVSGPAVVSNNVLTIVGAGTVVVDAWQPGNSNFNAAATVQRSFTVNAVPQTISFGTLSDQRLGDAPFALGAATTSGLPITYAVVSGPAIIAGDTLIITGEGTVTVRATQDGDGNFGAAASVDRTFTVSSPDFSGTSFGTFDSPATAQSLAATGVGAATSSDSWALQVASGNHGKFVAYLSERHSAIVVGVDIASDGTFSASDTENRPSGGAETVTVTGQITDGVVSGRVDPLGVTFSGLVDSALGDAQSVSGLYTASALGTSTGDAYVVVGQSGRVMIVTVTPSTVNGGNGTVDSAGGIAGVLADGGQIAGSLNATNQSLSVTLTSATSGSASFAGPVSTVAASNRIENLSTRAEVRTGDNIMIPGLVIAGSGTKRVLFRAVGPTLANDPFDVKGTIADPQIAIVRQSDHSVVGSSDNWGDSNSVQELEDAMNSTGAFPLPVGSKDAALVLDLPAGAYTVNVSGHANGTGIAIAEFYAVNDGENTSARLVNISTRAFVGVGDSIMIPGLVTSGNMPRRLLIRGVGPTLSLSPFKVTGVLDDPVLTVFQGKDAVASNDDWDSPGGNGDDIAAAAAMLGAFDLPRGSKDAALLFTVPPNTLCTIQISGKNGGTGVAIAEVYEIP